MVFGGSWKFSLPKSAKCSVVLHQVLQHFDQQKGNIFAQTTLLKQTKLDQFSFDDQFIK